MAEVSIKEVARVAGVSTATVSRCMNLPDQVKEATRLKVQAAIQKTGYTPNTLARDFRRGSTKIIIVVVPSVGDPFFSEVMRGIRSAAGSEGFSILIQEAATKSIEADEISSLIVSRQADGVILLDSLSPFGTEILSEQNRRMVPVAIGCETIAPELAHLPSVHINNVTAAKDATNYLISLGHRRISFVCGSRASLLTADRELGYRAAMNAAGLEVDDNWVTEGQMTLAGAEHATRHLLSLENPPTAIFCANDEMAIGCIHELKSLGYKVPDDISVMGFDNMRFAQVTDPPLTTVAQPAFEIGERVVFRLLLEIQNKANVERHQPPEIVPHELVIRNSVSRVNA